MWTVSIKPLYILKEREISGKKKEIKETLTKENTKDVLQAEIKGFEMETTSFREKEL